jgi:hypothetical protein
MSPRELFEKHAIPEEDRKPLATFITTGKAPPEFLEKFEANPNYGACAGEAIVELFKAFAEAVAEFDGKQ